jgi:uncharacterized protein
MRRNKQQITSLTEKSRTLEQTRAWVKRILSKDTTGHDWLHTERVARTALQIARKEKADTFVVELAALLHDVGDWKFHGGDETAGERISRRWLKKSKTPDPVIDHVCAIIQGVSFKGAHVKTPMRTLEGKIVQDADRLDAIGAIGIARAFAYGGAKGRPIYDPRVEPVLHRSFAHYKKNTAPTITHFYEKLLLLKDRMHTRTARSMAGERHRFVLSFLRQFFKEVV